MGAPTLGGICATWMGWEGWKVEIITYFCTLPCGQHMKGNHFENSGRQMKNQAACEGLVQVQYIRCEPLLPLVPKSIPREGTLFGKPVLYAADLCQRRNPDMRYEPCTRQERSSYARPNTSTGASWTLDSPHKRQSSSERVQFQQSDTSGDTLPQSTKCLAKKLC